MKANRIADRKTTNCRSSKYPLRISFTSHIAELDSSIVTVSLNHKLILEYSRMNESLQNIRMGKKKRVYREVWLLLFSEAYKIAYSILNSMDPWPELSIRMQSSNSSLSMFSRLYWSFGLTR